MHARTHGRTSPSGVEAAGARYGPIRAPPPPRKLSLAPGSTRSRPAPVACLKVPNRPSTVLFQAASSRRAGAESGARSASPVRTPPRPTSATTAAHPSSRASAATAERRSAPPAARRRGPGATAWWGSTTITDLGFGEGCAPGVSLARTRSSCILPQFHRLRAPRFRCECFARAAGMCAGEAQQRRAGDRNPRRQGARLPVCAAGACTSRPAFARCRARARARMHPHTQARTRGRRRDPGMAHRACGSEARRRRANAGSAARARVFLCLVAGVASVRGLSYQGEVRVHVRVQAWCNPPLCPPYPPSQTNTHALTIVAQPCGL